MKYLIASIICFVIALISLSQVSCVQWVDVEPPQGEFNVYAKVNVQEDWCIMPDGTEVYGLVKYNAIVRSVFDICVSLKSPHPQQTMAHEFDHVWRHAAGLDLKALNP